MNIYGNVYDKKYPPHQPGMVLVSHREVCPEDNRLRGEEVTLRARKVVLTVPPNLVNNISWSPPLHPLKQFACESLPMGRLTKFVVTYEKVGTNLYAVLGKDCI